MPRVTAEVSYKPLNLLRGAIPGWNASIRRWQMKPELVAKEEACRVALEPIRHLELKALRALRQHALGQATAIDRLKSIDDEIAQLRATLLS